MEKTVFLSYRRADTAGYAGRIDDDLERAFGQPVIFRDVESIDAGADFVDVLQRAIGRARVCVVLIGSSWLDARDAAGDRRLDASDDVVRKEVEMALDRADITVLPVLVQGAMMPAADQLPPSLRRLARLQAIELSETRWDYDIQRLVDALRAAGVATDASVRMPRWVMPTLALMVAGLLALAAWCLRDDTAAIEAYTGLWHLPNGGYWSIREKDAGFWVEETHHESREVWMRGPGQIEESVLVVTLAPVFDREDWRFLHRLRLSKDGTSLIGTVRRAGHDNEKSLVLSRTGP